KISLPSGITAAENIVVTYAITGSALNGTDYATLSGTATIVAGANEVLVPITVIDDNIIESVETVNIRLTGGSSANFVYTANSSATVTITDKDNTPANLTIQVVKLGDAAEPSTAGSFTVKLPTNITAAEPINVSYTIAGTAVNGGDYVSLSGNVIIPAGSNSV
ncbi:Calx-beta domain-containing protein, partial [Pedobacter borealis]|uniref:Calx-beta domain-containing protein n=1 Tax=Pedobacter borealis TaxID=475254 RepID=UPI00056A5B1D